MISPKLERAINLQINAETWSAYLYLAMAAYFESLNLKGFANWMRVQTQEEMVHAMKFYDYLIARSGRVRLAALAAPGIDWKSPLAAFRETYAHEQKVTALINALKDLALAEKDHATSTMLDWFVTEQVEEESSADAVVQKLKLIGSETSALFLLDQELATRVFTPPAAAGAGL